MKHKIMLLACAFVVFALVLGPSVMAASTPDKAAQKAEAPLRLVDAQKMPVESFTDRAKRLEAIHNAILDKNMDIKADNPDVIYARKAAIDEKAANLSTEQKYDAEKSDIISNFIKNGGETSLAKAAATLEADEFEPDNSHNQGEKLLDGFYSVKHTIFPAGDTDFFWFNGTAGQIVEIIVSTPTPYWGSKDDPYQLLPVAETDLDPAITLWAPDRSVLAEDDDSGYGWDSFINFQLPESGIYYISVASSSHWDPLTVGGYEIGFSVLTVDGYEPDNDALSANDLADDESVDDHTILPVGDVDVFKIDIPVPGAAVRGLVVATPASRNLFDWPDFYSADLDPAVDIFDAFGNLLYSIDDDANPVDPGLGIYDVEFIFSFPDPGTYYVAVYASPKAAGYNTQCGTYTISYDLTLPDPYEPDNLPPDANLIAYGETISDHTITSIMDGDLFKFRGSRGDYIQVNVDAANKCGELDPGVALFAEGGTVGNGSWGTDALDWLHSSMDDGIGLGACIIWGPLPANAWYYLEVGADPLSFYNWWERNGGYSISLEKVGDSESFPRNRNRAIQIELGETMCGIIPRTGEVWPDDDNVETIHNWYKFDGVEGMTIAAKVTTPFQYRSGCGTFASDWMDDLNPLIRLYDIDGTTRLATNRNIDPNNDWDDAEVVYTLPADGLYYLRVEAEIVEEGPLFEFFEESDSYGDYCIRVIAKPEVVDFDSDKNLGQAPLQVQFMDHCTIGDDPWAVNFDWDASYEQGLTMSGKEPAYCYAVPSLIGTHDVRKTASNSAGSVTEIKEDFVILYGPNGYAPLEVVEGFGDFSKEPWAAAVDADDYCWNGVATVREEVPGIAPWAILKFADGKTKQLNQIRIKADAGIGYENRWVRKIRVLSFDGDPTHSFAEILTATIAGGGWNSFSFSPAITTQTLRLEVLDSDLGYTGWRQIAEFEAYEDIVLPDMDRSLLSVTSPHLANGVDAAVITLTLLDAAGNPITTYDAGDIKFYLANCQPANFGAIDLSNAANGVYKTTLTTKVPGTYQVIAAAHGAIMLNDKPGDNYSPALVSFFGNAGQKGVLEFVSGSNAHPGEGWDNAVDGDREGWDGTVTTNGTPAYGIFKFSNDMRMPFNKIGLATDNGFADDQYEGRQVRKFSVYASDDMVTWTLAFQATRKNLGEMTHYRMPNVVFGKYVQLVIDQPEGGWRQLVEFEVIFDSKQGFADEPTEITALPETFELNNNYPNPFNPTTTISYQLPEERHVKISVFNVIGQQVAVLVDAKVAVGYHSVVWDAVDQPSGIYLYRIEAGDFVKTNRMVLLK